MSAVPRKRRKVRASALSRRVTATVAVTPATSGYGCMVCRSITGATLAFERQRLRGALKRPLVEFVHADRGIGLMLDGVGADISKATARVAASRKDYAKAAVLARMPSTNVLIEPAKHVIHAFLEEGNWRAAADIAKKHDPRRKKLIAGFDDDRAKQYVDLYVHLAFAAAYAGDDSAAITFLDQAEGVDRPEGDRDEDGLPGSLWFLRHYTYLAGAREGLLPRRYLHLLGPKLYFL